MHALIFRKTRDPEFRFTARARAIWRAADRGLIDRGAPASTERDKQIMVPGTVQYIARNRGELGRILGP